jgi:hypothetical protein
MSQSNLALQSALSVFEEQDLEDVDELEEEEADLEEEEEEEPEDLEEDEDADMEEDEDEEPEDSEEEEVADPKEEEVEPTADMAEERGPEEEDCREEEGESREGGGHEHQGRKRPWYDEEPEESPSRSTKKMVSQYTNFCCLQTTHQIFGCKVEAGSNVRKKTVTHFANKNKNKKRLTIWKRDTLSHKVEEIIAKLNWELSSEESKVKILLF